MKWIWDRVAWLHALVAFPPLLTLLLAIDVFAYFAGLLFWYGAVLANPLNSPPLWVWPFIPDCPLAGLLGGLGLLMMTAHRFWSAEAQARTQRALLIVGAFSSMIWLSTYIQGVPVFWTQLGPTIALWSWSLLIAGALFHRSPAWLLGLFAFGQIKYGIWTVTAWVVYWRNTALMLGTPDFNFISILMTVSHIALFGQGVFLLSYFKVTPRAALMSLLWYALSDYMDYGLGWYPSLPLAFIPLPIMQWHTIIVTFLLSGTYLWLSAQANPVQENMDGAGKNHFDPLVHPSA